MFGMGTGGSSSMFSPSKRVVPGTGVLAAQRAERRRLPELARRVHVWMRQSGWKKMLARRGR